ncbi:hypothetical protein ACE21V_002081 [Salmonella enterica]
MEITYSLSESLLMLFREVMVTGLAILSAWGVMLIPSARNIGKGGSVAKKKITSKAGFTYFIASQFVAFFISIMDSIFELKAGTITWNDEIRQFYLHVGLGLITCVFCLLVVLHEKFIRKNEKVYSDYGGSLIVTLTGTAVLSVLYLAVTSPLHYDEHQLSDVYVVASDGNENSVIFADGHYWLFDLELPSFNRTVLKEVTRGRHHLICTSELKAICWSGKKLPKNATPIEAS